MKKARYSRLRSVWEQPDDTPEPERHWRLLWDVLLPGAVAGLVGGLAMALVAGGLSAVLEGNPWEPFRLVSGLFYRESPPQGGWPVVVGLLTHIAMSGGVATAFALLLPRGATGLAALSWGLLYSLVVWATMVFLILPFASPPLERAGWRSGLLLVHLIFGGALALIPYARRLLHSLYTWRQRLRMLSLSLGEGPPVPSPSGRGSG